jgi:hypothetical protein
MNHFSTNESRLKLRVLTEGISVSSSPLFYNPSKQLKTFMVLKLIPCFVLYVSCTLGHSGSSLAFALTNNES